MLARGMTRWLADGRLEQFEWIRHGGADTVTPTVREVTGTDPRSVEDWTSSVGPFSRRTPAHRSCHRPHSARLPPQRSAGVEKTCVG
jgi:hypothetical protein